MPEIQVDTTIDLDSSEKSDLARILGVEEGSLEVHLRPIASAAMTEYVRMILGQSVFSRGSDMREYRLFLLIGEYFENRIPDEEDVCRLFQTTSTESRSLIRSVMSKYQYQLQRALERSIESVMRNADQQLEGGEFRVVINSKTVVEALNRALADEDGSLQPVKKVRNSVSTYEISPASYEVLRQHFANE